MVQNAKMLIVIKSLPNTFAPRKWLQLDLSCFATKKKKQKSINLIRLDLHLKFPIVAMESRRALFSSHEVHATYNAAWPCAYMSYHSCIADWQRVAEAFVSLGRSMNTRSKESRWPPTVIDRAFEDCAKATSEGNEIQSPPMVLWIRIPEPKFGWTYCWSC